ncbi:MAG: cell division protein FtsL [Zetaproteobacteria bacterium CG06_land_8_20_14_3_00_59_53]|nr:MAG: cell division protein FtsL [Zetaproteobacteria bacterium CG2_30_59_37]PIO89493.1 MAG: cell division protein FtsL [Zetaproteobacteria bacterium CG23_combo_of_CG06-09_8_20_14_all_59_86]PIQ65517.1 MAG: cell division protein FtsL [Zetaproteobacteria bacterium CG11_big_fil_rev_8_21_14_0_20_59_439]PIU69769.1 MAG: cell division protein FtsL [Zetaproteobacteria bacterium CG06_land_8_20_14_3_00_59_53]PIU97019.1 MAG: cell division protein FtsL [Zetaproteobacteria bacterium CG03_land_8_20_14_0_80_
MTAAPRLVRPWLLLCLAVVMLATAQVAVAHQRLTVAGEANLLQRAVQQAGDEVNRLNIELAMLTRPERLRELAINELGMRPPTAAQVVNP